MDPYTPYGYGDYGYYSKYPQKPISLMWSKARVQLKRYGAVLHRLGWVLPLTISLGVCISAWVVSQMPPDYRSMARMIGSGQFQFNQENAVYNEQMENFYGTQIALMQSLEVQKRATMRVQALHPELQPEHVILDVSQEPHATILNLSVEAGSAAYAQAFLNALMDEYLDTKRKQRLERSDITTDNIQEDLARLDKVMDENDAAMHDFQKANNIGFLQNEGNAAAAYLAQKNREMADLKQEYNLLQMLDLDQNLDRERAAGASAAQAAAMAGTAAVDANGKDDYDSFLNSGPIAEYEKAKQQLDLLNSQKAELSHNLRPAHPLMVSLDREIEKENDLIKTLREQSIEALKTHRDSIALQIQNLEDVIKEWEAKALDLSTRISEFDKIKAKSDRAKEEYDRLLSYKDSVNSAKNVDQDTIQILEQASEGVSVKPGLIKIVLAGFGGGLFIGLLILFCIDQLDDRINSFLELQTQFDNTILGQVPREEFMGEAALLRHNDDRLAVLEAFRSLRSSLIFFPVEGARPKTLLITSALPNEGKTTISANLAITLAFSGARTLLVDADMRRGRLSHLFGVTEGNGFSSVLVKALSWQEALHVTAIDNLSLLSCGPPLKHPAEHLLGKVTDQFLKEIYDLYDYVIFDSPPVTLLDDTLSLAPKIDGTMVVVRFGVSSVRTTRRTLELLTQRQTNILGLICNDVQLAESEYNYGYYYRQTIANYKKEIRTPA